MPVDVKPSTYIDFNVEKILKTLNLKLVTMWEYQNIKILLEKLTLYIGLKKCLWLQKLKKHCALNIWYQWFNGEEIVRLFHEKEL